MAHGKKPRRMLARLVRDERGQTTVEYMLIVAAFGIPLVWVMRRLLEVLAEHYRMISFLETLPYP